VLSVVSVVEAVEEASIPGLYPVEVLLVIVDIKAWLGGWISGPVLHWSRWVEAVAERPIQVYLHWKEGTTSDSRYQVGGWIEFQDIWAGLTLKSLGGRREAASFICCERWNPSIAKAERISLDQVLAVELNFRTIEPVSHSSRSVV